MGNFFVSIYQLVEKYSIWYSASFFIELFVFLFMVIGWFFSTDYFDEFCSDTTDNGPIVTFLIIANIAGLYLNLHVGTSDLWTIVFNTSIWIFLVLPMTGALLLDYRLHIRKKRGKE